MRGHWTMLRLEERGGTELKELQQIAEVHLNYPRVAKYGGPCPILLHYEHGRAGGGCERVSISINTHHTGWGRVMLNRICPKSKLLNVRSEFRSQKMTCWGLLCKMLRIFS